ncbi:response regulator [Rickettsiales endosymbiont of Stachyamoeba lipophora]|uniref:response regulator n=1 Tax=Rickettsiales endosymbiont of Stachyamoeba lipophora TaxID=2486578 RepID=UPI000F64B8FC|nr:response regulator [Rickettsiales endosymbiont of Stachyamoeba lipophora]AZL15238.1 response regulator [Rickettsiales endosymbiont of Stachyamoeba lipophora]
MQPKTILLVDDEQICIDSVEMILDGTDYKLMAAASGSQAMEILNEHGSKVNLILLDLMMLDCHGLELLQQIKDNPKLTTIPIILQTGSHNERDIAMGISLGAASCIYKPFKRAALINMIDSVLNPHKLNS